MKKQEAGIIHSDEAYSKAMVLAKLDISQKFWDKLLDEGLPFANVGHTRWVIGKHLIEHLAKNSTTKQGKAK